MISVALIGVLCAHAQKPTLVVVEKIAGAVGFYTDDGKRVGGAQVGKHPHEVIISPDQKQLYVSDNGILWMTEAGEGGNTISIVDIATMKRVGAIDLGQYRRPHGMDIDRKNGRLVVTIENPDGLLLIDLASRKVLRKYDVKGADPHMVLLSADGRTAYVSNTASNALAAVNLDSGEVKMLAAEARPQGATWSRDGKFIYLTNSDGNSILIFDAATSRRSGRIATCNGPGRIAVTPDGKTVVYNCQAGQAVGFADIATRKQTTVIPLGGNPLSLTMSVDGGFAYAGIQDQDKVIVVSVPDRKILRTIQTPKSSGPDPALPLP
jgi:DNA-binding beta-propeller fold protein YncE